MATERLVTFDPTKALAKERSPDKLRGASQGVRHRGCVTE
jgi:hypothetical protein